MVGSDASPSLGILSVPLSLDKTRRSQIESAKSGCRCGSCLGFVRRSPPPLSTTRPPEGNRVARGMVFWTCWGEGGGWEKRRSRSRVECAVPTAVDRQEYFDRDGGGRAGIRYRSDRRFLFGSDVRLRAMNVPRTRKMCVVAQVLVVSIDRSEGSSRVDPGIHP